MVTDPNSILARWRNHFSQLLDILGFNDVRQTEIHTAEPLVFEPSAFEFELAINPSAWSDGHRPHTVNITCRGVMGTARMLHALTHSSISRQVREQMQSSCFVLVREGAGSLIVWERVPRNYFFIFSLLSNFGLSFCST